MVTKTAASTGFERLERRSLTTELAADAAASAPEAAAVAIANAAREARGRAATLGGADGVDSCVRAWVQALAAQRDAWP